MADVTQNLMTQSHFPSWLVNLVSRPQRELDKTHTELRALNDHMLEDIGLTRADLPVEMRSASQDAATALHLMSLGHRP